MNIKSTYLCATDDELTRLIQNEVPSFMLFVDNIVLVDKSRYGVNFK